MGRPYTDLTGQRFGKILVIGVIDESGGGGVHKKWLCRCDCGTEWVVKSSHLVSGQTQCKKCRDKNFCKAGVKHGYSTERLYHIWRGMQKRCYNKNSKSYVQYGGRGIRVCDEWGADSKDISGYLVFRNWALSSGYSDDLSIDRIDVDGSYCPDNCRWADFHTQHTNKRNTVILTVDGVTMPLVDWSDKSGIKQSTIRRRIKHGWSAKDAVTIHV